MNRPEYNTPEYKAWRYAVLVRDNFTCQLTSQKGGDLQVHHIERWADAPHLRFAVSNGITLSKEAHDLVTGREDDFRDKFKRMIQMKMDHERSKKKIDGSQPSAKLRKKLRTFKWRPRNPYLRY